MFCASVWMHKSMDSRMAACDHELNQICDDICSVLTWTALWTKDTEAK